MKIQLESLHAHQNSSFSLMYNPRLSDLFFWHFHPEYELVYIEAENGPRHVGDHISEYVESDLVLIGSNIPHLNFDYGVKSEYKKAVAHLNHEFVEDRLMKTPELSHIGNLLAQSKYGIAFHGSIKREIGDRMFLMENKKRFEQYLLLLEILEALGHSDEYELLHKMPYSIKHSDKDQARLRELYTYIDHHYSEKIELKTVAAMSNMTKEAFCRYFKKATGSTFIDFLNRYRISQSKRLLMEGRSVSTACYNSGFESLSYYNRIFKKITDENPSQFRRRYY